MPASSVVARVAKRPPWRIVKVVKDVLKGTGSDLKLVTGKVQLLRCKGAAESASHLKTSLFRSFSFFLGMVTGA